MKRIFLFVTIFAFAFTSCKKDKKDDSCSLSEANLVGSYKVTSVKYKLNASSPEQDGTALYFFEDCEKDDLLIFNADHTAVSSDAGVACSPNGTFSTTWALSGTTLLVEGEPVGLENFSCSGFNGIINDYEELGDKITVTYTRQ